MVFIRVLKFSYIPRSPSEAAALKDLDFHREKERVSVYRNFVTLNYCC